MKLLTKIKIEPREIISLIILLVIGLLLGIQSSLKAVKEQKRKDALDMAYSVVEAGKLIHLNEKIYKTVIYNEKSNLDYQGNSNAKFLLKIDRYQNASLSMWIDNQFCVKKANNNSEIKIEDSKTSEQDCLNEQWNVTELLANHELLEETAQTGYDKEIAFVSQKYYAGVDPNNYVIFSNACFRIVNIANNNTVKIVYDSPATSANTCGTGDGKLARLAWDQTESNDWDRPATLRNVFDTWLDEENANNKIQALETDQLVAASWYIGPLKLDNKTTLKNLVQLERSKISNHNAKLGLLNVSDYVKASTDIECDTKKLLEEKNNACRLDNYLYQTNYPWFMNAVSDTKDRVYLLSKNGGIKANSASEEQIVRPVAYLSSSIRLRGSGSASNPYLVITE